MHKQIEKILHENKYSAILTQLKFSQKESEQLNWLKDGGEFKYHDEMYDIVRTETTIDGDIIYHCIKDEKESDLYKDIERDLTSSEDQSSSNHFALQLFNFLSHMYFTDSSPIHSTVYFTCEMPNMKLPTFPIVYGNVACEPPDAA